jgi:hypothetical protein
MKPQISIPQSRVEGLGTHFSSYAEALQATPHNDGGIYVERGCRVLTVAMRRLDDTDRANNDDEEFDTCHLVSNSLAPSGDAIVTV